jgi:predicted DNA repair protein MutK
VPGIGGVLGWLANTAASAAVGVVIGLLVVTVVERLPSRRKHERTSVSSPPHPG